MGSSNSTQDNATSCSNCDIQLTRSLRKRKRKCLECHSIMCHNCLLNLATAPNPGTTRAERRIVTGYCISCTIMLAPDPVGEELARLKVRHLKGFLVRRNVQEVSGCVEKRELVELVLAKIGGPSYMHQQQTQRDRLRELLRQHSSQPLLYTNRVDAPSGRADSMDTEESTATAEIHTSDTIDAEVVRNERTEAGVEEVGGGDGSQVDQRVHPAESSGTTTPTVEQTHRPPETNAGDTNSVFSIPSQPDTQVKPGAETLSKISLDEIESMNEVEHLSVKQLKVILTRNLVNYHGCKEKHELISKVKMLWQSRQDNQKLYEKLLNPQVSEDSAPNAEDKELCKICMDSTIDCVLLNCGHMVTCTSCGKQMNECPICRQFVVRAVHIFRA